MSPQPGFQEGVTTSNDVELAEVRLINGGGETSGQPHSWYTANGRGYSVNGRQAEANGGLSHVSTVLGEAFYNRERRRERMWACLTERPHPAFNMASVAFAGTTLLLLVLLMRERPSADSGQPPANWNASAQDNLSPEGRIYGDIGLTRDYRGRPRMMETEHGMVAADHGRCSDLGMKVLKDGGNAVDAAVATVLCQGIYNPMASGVGGGMFMVIRAPNGTSEVIDAREVAPAAANETMFLGNTTASLEGGLAVSVPLELKGLWLAHQRHGVADWASLVTPAADLARNGFPAHPYLINALVGSQPTLTKYPELRQIYFKPDGSGWRPLHVNESCCQRPKLAAFLDHVALEGPGVVFDKHAQTLAQEIQAAGGIVTAEDFTTAQPVVKQPLRSTVWGLEIVGAPPPSSAAVVIAGLHILAGYPLPVAASPGLSQHRTVEALKSAFALRMHLGDPGNCTNASSANCFLDLAQLVDDTLSPSFADLLRSGLLDNQTQSYDQYGGPWHANSSMADDHGTSHMSIVDAQRGAVSLTTTVNTGFGSKVYSPSTGILFSNQLDDFSTPGQDNVYGLAPSKANFIRPGKKPLSSMSPLILSSADGTLRAVLGASGGPRIVSAVLQTFVRLVALGQDPLVAIATPRLHHQLLPDTVFAEDWHTTSSAFLTSNITLQALRARGHVVTATDWAAVSQVVVVDPDTTHVIGCSDPRKDGAASGY